jgi:hypothetical protein
MIIPRRRLLSSGEAATSDKPDSVSKRTTLGHAAIRAFQINAQVVTAFELWPELDMNRRKGRISTSGDRSMLTAPIPGWRRWRYPVAAR